MPDNERIRLAAFDFLARQSRAFPDTLPWKVLSEGFTYGGRRIPLIGPQGIFKPAGVRLPLSIATAPVVRGKERPYDDEIGRDDTIRYRYRGTDPNHRDNVGLRAAMLEHGLQGFHGATLVVPTAAYLQPNREFLAERYDIFRKAS